MGAVQEAVADTKIDPVERYANDAEATSQTSCSVILTNLET
jgi:hypothetical protein